MRTAAIMFFTAAMLNAQEITSAEVRDIAQRAYVCVYPLVLIEATRGSMPLNRFIHAPHDEALPPGQAWYDFGGDRHHVRIIPLDR